MSKTDYEMDLQWQRRTDLCVFTLLQAVDSRTDSEFIEMGFGEAQVGPKHWPSSVPELDLALEGGFYGFTVFAAPPGAGKSTLALASAIEAASTDDWEVVMLVAEDDVDGLRERFTRFMEAHKTLNPFGHLFIHLVGRGQTPTSLALTVAHSVDRSLNRKLLVVMDSINSVVNLGTGDYFRAMNDIAMWAMQSRRMSHGDVAWLVIGETNKDGHIKGRNLAFWADCAIKLRKESKDVVEIIVDKSRRTGGEGSLGQFSRVVTRGTFEKEPGKVAAQRHLHAVGDDDPFQ